MLTLFAFGTFWFWLFLSISVVFIVTVTESEDTYPFHWFIPILIPVILYFTGCKEEISRALSYIQENPLNIVLIFFGYLAIGTVWSVVKWYFYLINLREEFREYRTLLNSDGLKFNVKYNKERILSWMTYWPFSAVWTLINDPIKKTFQKIFKSLESKFQKISDSVFPIQKQESGNYINKKFEQSYEEFENEK
jgi:hypothetical protein